MRVHVRIRHRVNFTQRHALWTSQVTPANYSTLVLEEEEDGQDSLEEIDPSNILSSGRRTRGKQIDFAAAAAKEGLPEDDEDDDDFHTGAQEDDDEMQD